MCSKYTVVKLVRGRPHTPALTQTGRRFKGKLQYDFSTTNSEKLVSKVMIDSVKQPDATSTSVFISEETISVALVPHVRKKREGSETVQDG